MADPVAIETLIQLLRLGVFELEDIEEMARRLDDAGDERAAHRVRATLIEASIDRDAERRDNIVVIPSMRMSPSDGGKPE